MAAYVALAWITTASTLLAAKAAAPAAPTTNQSYGIPYALVVLGIVLGLLIVCRSSNRTNEISLSDD